MSFLAERTGGDAAKLSAPVGVHGSEALLAEDETLSTCDASLHFTFLCENMLVRSKTSLLACSAIQNGHIRHLLS